MILHLNKLFYIFAENTILLILTKIRFVIVTKNIQFTVFSLAEKTYFVMLVEKRFSDLGEKNVFRVFVRKHVFGFCEKTYFGSSDGETYFWSLTKKLYQNSIFYSITDI